MILRRHLCSTLWTLLILAIFAASCGGADSSTDSTPTVPDPMTFAEGDSGDSPSGDDSPSDGGDRIVIALRGSLDDSPLWVAESEGFFESAGLDVELRRVGTENQLFSALAANDAQLAVLPTSVAVRRAAVVGESYEFLAYLDGTQAGVSEERGTMSLVTGVARITRGCDLEGRIVGVDSFVSMPAIAIREMVGNDGCDPDAVQFVIDDSPSHIEQLESGVIDAAAMLDPFTSRALREENQIVANLDDELCPSFGRCPLTMVVGGRPWSEANPEIVKRFQLALDATMFWIRQNELDFRAELVSCCGLTADDAAEVRVPNFVGEQRSLRGDLPRLVDILVGQGRMQTTDVTEEVTRAVS